MRHKRVHAVTVLALTVVMLTSSGCRSLRVVAGEAMIVGTLAPIGVVGGIVGAPMLLFIPPDSDKINGVREYVFVGNECIIAACAVGRRQLLFKIPLDGSDAVPLTTGDRHDFDLAASPNGRYVAFSSAPDARSKRLGITHLCRLDVHSGQVTALTQGRVGHRRPSFSPDSQWIVYKAYTGGKQADLRVIPTAGGPARTLTRDPDTHDSFPQFHPDGDRIVFARAHWYGHSSPICGSEWHGWRICEVSLDGGEVTVLRKKCLYRISRFRLSPKGDMALYQSIRNSHGCTKLVFLDHSDRLVEFAPRGEQYTLGIPDVDDEGAAVEDPVFHPQGEQVLFSLLEYDEDEKPFRELNTAAVSTREPVRITNLRHQTGLEKYTIRAPNYSPDGKRIAFLLNPAPGTYDRRWELWLMDTHGGEPRRLALPE